MDLSEYADYPITEIIEESHELLSQENRLVLQASTGAGKSTLFPVSLLDTPWLEGKKIIVLEPRRLAAKSVAARMSEIVGKPLGSTIGYKIRNESKTSGETKIEVVTEGILTNMLQSDNFLEGYQCVIFDEFHERNIHSDIGVALIQELQQLRPELRMIIMSATIEMDAIAQKLDAKTIQSDGRFFPVDLEYVGHFENQEILQQTSITIQNAIKQDEGDVLVFLPGRAWIQKLKNVLLQKPLGVEIHELHGSLDFGAQQKAVVPGNSRKVILSTNIAETSLTIQGIGVVIDTGLEFRAKFNPNSGVNQLDLVRVSQQSAEQRKGRAGREKPGKCYRIWSKATQMQMKAFTDPEIQTADLIPLVLTLASWGNPLGNDLNWITTPAKFDIHRAYDYLESIGAIDQNSITDYGKSLSKIPSHPRVANMILKAKAINLLPLACDCAAFVEEKDPLSNNNNTRLFNRIEGLRKARRNRQLGSFSLIEQAAGQIAGKNNIQLETGVFEEEDLGRLLAFAFPDRIAKLIDHKQSLYLMANGNNIIIPQPYLLEPKPWMLALHVNLNKKVGISLLDTPIEESVVKSIAIRTERIEWDKTIGLVAEEQLKVGSIVIQSIKIKSPDPAQIEIAILEAIANYGEQLLDWSDQVEQLLIRLYWLRKWYPNEELPEWDRNNLLKQASNWLTPYLNGVRTNKDLKGIDLYQVLFYQLAPEHQTLLNQATPFELKLENGQNAKIKYQKGEHPAIVEIKLQHCFGVLQTPTVNNGKVKVLMHLLSPGYKLVQITGDMDSFWKNAYHEIRKELRIKYKKHPWPADPSTS
jgi:ATP-dependent helicase HrpB